MLRSTSVAIWLFAAAAQQIAFPMAGNGPILDVSRSLPDRHGVADPPVVGCFLRVVARPAHRPRPPQVLEQLFLQRTARLDEERAVDRLV